MNYPNLTRILATKFPKLKLDKNTRDLDKIGMILIDDKPVSIEEFQSSKNFKIDGDFILINNKEITSLPENLEVSGDLYLRDSKITSLPKGLKVGGILFLDGSNITSIPQGLGIEVKGMHIGGNAEITSLPDDLKVLGLITANDPSKIKCSEELRKKIL